MGGMQTIFGSSDIEMRELSSGKLAPENTETHPIKNPSHLQIKGGLFLLACATTAFLICSIISFPLDWGYEAKLSLMGLCVLTLPCTAYFTYLACYSRKLLYQEI